MAESEIFASTEALERIPLALKRFRGFALEHVRNVRASLRHVHEQLQDAANDARASVRRIEDEIRTADEEDDTGGLEDELYDASRLLEATRRAVADSDRIIAAYQHEAEKLRRLIDEQVPRADALLLRKAEALRTLRSIQTESDYNRARVPVSGHAPLVAPASSRTALSSSPLPIGYTWVRLSDIDLQDALSAVQTPEDFRSHATYGMLRQGLETLRDTVLPAIAKHGYTADDFFFAELDACEGLDPESGARRAFESFFRSDAIALDRRADGRLGVTNGRHRIKAALDAGWDAIPARIIGDGIGHE